MSQKQDPNRKSAVSIKYDPEKGSAPKVTAKGEGLVGERIIALARENNVPIKEDPNLVQILAGAFFAKNLRKNIREVKREEGPHGTIKK